MPSFCQLSRLVRRRETSVEGQPQFALRPGPSLAILIAKSIEKSNSILPVKWLWVSSCLIRVRRCILSWPNFFVIVWRPDFKKSWQTQWPIYLLQYSASESHLRYQHRGRHKKPNSFYLSKFDLWHRSPSLDHRRQTPKKRGIPVAKSHYLFILQRPWHAFAFFFDFIQVHLSLTFFPVVNKIFLLMIRKLFEVWCSSHLLQHVHCIRSTTKRSVLC